MELNISRKQLKRASLTMRQVVVAAYKEAQMSSEEREEVWGLAGTGRCGRWIADFDEQIEPKEAYRLVLAARGMERQIQIELTDNPLQDIDDLIEALKDAKNDFQDNGAPPPVLEQTRSLVQEWVDKKGHDQCHYYPEIFRKLVDVLGIKWSDPGLPPEGEFKDECDQFRGEIYAEARKRAGREGDQRSDQELPPSNV